MEESKSVSGAPAWGVAKILYQQRNVPGLVICYVAIENGPVEIVDLPMNSMVDLSSSLCKRLPEGNLYIQKIISEDA